MITKYQHLNTGVPTTADDPERGVWYSSHCTYWTDEWDTLRLVMPHRLPVCPHCGSPGYQMTAREYAVPASHEDKYPGYTDAHAKNKNAPCQPLTKWLEQFK